MMKETEVINISGNFVIYSSFLPYLVSDLSHYFTAGLYYLLAHISVVPRHTVFHAAFYSINIRF